MSEEQHITVWQWIKFYAFCLSWACLFALVVGWGFMETTVKGVVTLAGQTLGK